MGREDLVVAYRGGSLSRRTFIRLLVGTGVTLGAATAYAAAFSPAASAITSQRCNSDLYERGGNLYERGGNLYERGGNLYERCGNLYERGGNLYEKGGNLYEKGGNLYEKGRHEVPNIPHGHGDFWRTVGRD
jgi:hypothetical protein